MEESMALFIANEIKTVINETTADDHDVHALALGQSIETLGKQLQDENQRSGAIANLKSILDALDRIQDL